MVSDLSDDNSEECLVTSQMDEPLLWPFGSATAHAAMIYISDSNSDSNGESNTVEQMFYTT